MTSLDHVLKSRDITLPEKVHIYSQSYGFSCVHVWMWELDYKESWVPKNWCFWTVVLEKTLESPLDYKKIHPKGNQSNIHWKDWCWGWNSNTLASWYEELTYWKRWERLKAGGEGDDREWDRWMASPMGWTLVWVGSGSWWWTGKPGMLQSIGWQSQPWMNDWTELDIPLYICTTTSLSIYLPMDI